MPSFFVWFLSFLGARGKPSQRERLRCLLPLREFVIWEWLGRLIILITAFLCVKICKKRVPNWFLYYLCSRISKTRNNGSSKYKRI